MLKRANVKKSLKYQGIRKGLLEIVSVSKKTGHSLNQACVKNEDFCNQKTSTRIYTANYETATILLSCICACSCYVMLCPVTPQIRGTKK